jgi:hypothetical protein
MDDISKSRIKNFAKDTEDLNNKTDTSNNASIKKCHFLDEKYFIVIDKSVIDTLGLLDDNIYFRQEVTEDGILLLRPLQLRKTSDGSC